MSNGSRSALQRTRAAYTSARRGYRRKESEAQDALIVWLACEEHIVTIGTPGNRGELDQRATRLATERAALFDKAGANFGLSAIDQRRLQVVERELDECFLARRLQRAEKDARRFERDGLGIRRAMPRPPTR